MVSKVPPPFTCQFRIPETELNRRKRSYDQLNGRGISVDETTQRNHHVKLDQIFNENKRGLFVPTCYHPPKQPRYHPPNSRIVPPCYHPPKQPRYHPFIAKHFELRTTKSFNKFEKISKKKTIRRALSDKEITVKITTLKRNQNISLDEFAQQWKEIYEKYGFYFNEIHISAMFHAAATVFKNSSTKIKQQFCIKNNEIFQSLSNKFMNGIQKAKPQELANINWSCAILEYKNYFLFNSIKKEFKQEIENFKPKEFINMVWSFAKLGYKKNDLEELLDIIEYLTRKKINQFNNQDLVELIWSFAKFKYKNKDLLIKISDKIKEKLKDFKAKELANIIWACVELDFKDEDLFEAFKNILPEKIEEFNPRDLAEIALNYANLGYKYDDLFQLIIKISEKKIEKFKLQDLVVTAWAFSLLNSEKYDYFILDLLNRVKRKFILYPFSFVFLNLLYQTYLYLKHVRKISTNHLDSFFLENLQKIGYYKPTISDFHEEVANILKKLEIPFKNEKQVGSYYLDIVISENPKIAIEIQGPVHYISDDATEFTPKTKMKGLILSNLGWNIIYINYHDWRYKTQDEKKIILKELIECKKIEFA